MSKWKEQARLEKTWQKLNIIIWMLFTIGILVAVYQGWFIERGHERWCFDQLNEIRATDTSGREMTCTIDWNYVLNESEREKNITLIEDINITEIGR